MILWPPVPLSRWLILDLTLPCFSFQFREPKGLIQFLWCRGEELRVQTGDPIALCVLESSQQWQPGKHCQHHYTQSPVICLTVHTNLTASWAEYSGCNPNPKICHPSALQQHHICGCASAIHQNQPTGDRDRGDRQRFKRPGEELSSRKMRQKSKTSFLEVPLLLQGMCISPKASCDWGRKTGSVTLPQPLLAASLLSEYFKTFLDKILVKRLLLMLYMSNHIMLIREHWKDKICSNNLVPLLIPGQGRLSKCFFFFLFTMKFESLVSSPPQIQCNLVFFFPTD